MAKEDLKNARPSIPRREPAGLEYNKAPTKVVDRDLLEVSTATKILGDKTNRQIADLTKTSVHILKAIESLGKQYKTSTDFSKDATKELKNIGRVTKVLLSSRKDVGTVLGRPRIRSRIDEQLNANKTAILPSEDVVKDYQYTPRGLRREVSNKDILTLNSKLALKSFVDMFVKPIYNFTKNALVLPVYKLLRTGLVDVTTKVYDGVTSKLYEMGGPFALLSKSIQAISYVVTPLVSKVLWPIVKGSATGLFNILSGTRAARKAKVGVWKAKKKFNRIGNDSLYDSLRSNPSVIENKIKRNILEELKNNAKNLQRSFNQKPVRTSSGVFKKPNKLEEATRTAGKNYLNLDNNLKAQEKTNKILDYMYDVLLDIKSNGRNAIKGGAGSTVATGVLSGVTSGITSAIISALTTGSGFLLKAITGGLSTGASVLTAGILASLVSIFGAFKYGPENYRNTGEQMDRLYNPNNPYNKGTVSEVKSKQATMESTKPIESPYDSKILDTLKEIKDGIERGNNKLPVETTKMIGGGVTGFSPRGN